MTATYDPGTLAIATVRGVPNVRVFRWRGHSGTFWQLERLVDGCSSADDHDVTDVRPAVVIDPDDREQVERLAWTTHVALTGDVPSWPTLSGKDQVRRMDALTMALHAEIDAVRVLFEGVTQ